MSKREIPPYPNTEKKILLSKLENLDSGVFLNIVRNQEALPDNESYARTFFERILKHGEYRDMLLGSKVFSSAIGKYPILDLGSGLENNAKVIAGKLEEMGCKKYVGVDIHNNSKVPEHFESGNLRGILIRSDILMYLRGCQPHSSNVLICGFDYFVSHPNNLSTQDIYRALLLSQIEKVVPKDGFMLCVNSDLEGQFERQALTPADFGFVVERDFAANPDKKGISDKILWVKK